MITGKSGLAVISVTCILAVHDEKGSASFLKLLVWTALILLITSGQGAS